MLSPNFSDEILAAQLQQRHDRFDDLKVASRCGDRPSVTAGVLFSNQRPTFNAW